MDPLALGRYLRESREAKERTLDEAVAHLRIRRAILESFEQGDFNVAETPVQVRGLLRNYARFLELDEEKVLQYYEAASRPPERRRRRRGRREASSAAPIAPRKITDTPPSLPEVTLSEQRRGRGRSLLSSLLLLLTGAVAMGFIVFVVSQTLLPPPEQEGENGEAIAGQGTASGTLQTETATFTPSWTPQTPEDTPTQTPPFSGQGVVLIMEITQRSWLRLTVDGSVQFTGIAEPGDVFQYNAITSVEASASNAAGLSVTYNGQVQSPFGERGQRVDLVFSSTGIEVTAGPGPEPTPEPSPTPPPTPTPLVLAETADPTPEAPDTPAPPAGDSAAAPEAPPSPDTGEPAEPTATAFDPSTDPDASDTADSAADDPTPVVELTPTAGVTPSPLPTDTPTITNTPEPTAVLPPRVTPADLPPTKPPA